jgi:hypothetical protein
MTEDTSAERNRSSVRPPRGDSTTVSEPSPGGLTAFGKQLPVVILVTVVGLPAVGAALAGVGGVGSALRATASVLQTTGGFGAVAEAQAYAAGGGTGVWAVAALVVLRLADLVFGRR